MNRPVWYISRRKRFNTLEKIGIFFLLSVAISVITIINIIIAHYVGR